MPKELANKARKYFFQFIKETGPDRYNLWHHVPEVERWAKKLLVIHSEANEDVVILGVWFHDIAHYLYRKEGDDHAVMGQKIIDDFCKRENIDPNIAAKANHCVRAHRNKDVKPETIEAKIIACADSASHMTGICYLDMLQRDSINDILSKIDRDYRDIGLFPELQNEMKPIYKDWKKLIADLSKII